MKDFEGTAIAQAFSRSMIQLGDIEAELCGGDLRQIGAFGQVLTQQAVSVLVGAAFPGVVGMGEVDRQIESAFQLDRTGELAAVVQGQAPAFLGGQSAKGSLELLGDRLGGAGGDLACDQIAAGPIHTGQKIAATTFAHHGVAFPMAELPPVVSLFRAFVDGAFADDLAPARGLAVGLATGLAGDPQERTELMCPLGIGPDPPIDRRMADREAFQARRGTGRQTTGDLLRRPVVRQTLGDVGHQAAVTGLGLTQVGPPSAVGQGLGIGRIIAALDAGVAFALPADGGSMTADAACDLGVGITLESHSADDISFVHGKMVVRHREHSVV